VGGVVFLFVVFVWGGGGGGGGGGGCKIVTSCVNLVIPDV